MMDVREELLRKEEELQIQSEELEKYKLIIENTNDIVIILDKNFCYEYVNQSFCDILDYTREEIIGKNPLKFIHPNDLPVISKIIQQLEKDGRQKGEGRFKHKNGYWLWIEGNGRVIRLANGNSKVVLVARDITERKKAKEEIEVVKKKLTLYLESMMDGLCVNNKNGIMTEVNRSFVEMFGYKSRKEFIGKTIFAYIVEREIPRVTKRFMETIQKREGQIKEIEVMCQKEDGSEFLVSFNIRNLMENNNYTGSISIARDITKHKQMEEKLQKQNEELKKLDHLKEEFYEDITHELRTPLVAIKGFIELLLKDSSNLDNTQIEDLNRVLRNEKQIENLVEEILFYSKLKNNRIEFKEEGVNVVEILEMLREEFTPLINNQHLNISLNINHENLLLDKMYITRLIKNLFDNAIKYSYPNKTIFIQSVLENGIWTFSIRDQGIGIAKENIGKLFKRFSRVDMNRKGIGIGLAICRKIIDHYGGKIWVESDGLNKGSTFLFTIKIS